MGTVHALPARPVQALWAPRKGINPAWRVGAAPAVLSFSAATQAAAKSQVDSSALRAISSELIRKYGADRNYSAGFDLSLVTEKEYQRYMRIRREAVEAHEQGASV